MTKQTAKKAVGKTNLTLKLDTELVRALKIVAAKRGSSISALVTNNLERIVQEQDEYEQAMRRSIARMKEGWAFDWQKPKSRDELHER